ncbi:hypothetical protein Ddc_02758 [Ditylenchus destructor]|nr:hypothetical protein Ddc_02758 [Ditylenchus destructor]
MSDSFGANRFSGNEGSPTDGEDDEDGQCEDDDTIAQGPTIHPRKVLQLDLPTSSHARDELSTHQRSNHQPSKILAQQESRVDASNNLNWSSKSKSQYTLESTKTRNHQAQCSEAKQPTSKSDHPTSSRKKKRDTSRNRVEMKVYDHYKNGCTKGSAAAKEYWDLVNTHFTAKVKKGHFPKDIPPPSAVHETIELERANLQKTFQALPNSEILVDHKQNNILVEDDVPPHKHQRVCLDYTTQNINISPLNLRADAESNEAAEKSQKRESCRAYENLFGDAAQYDILGPDPEYYRRRVNKLTMEETVRKLREIRVRCRQTRLEKERIVEEKQRLDELERERRSSLSTYDLPPSRLTTERSWQPMSARQPMSHRAPLRSSMRNLEARKLPSDPAIGIPKKARSKSPFITAANQRNHVSFSVPANGQQLLSIIKNNQPCLLGLAQRVFQSADKNRILLEFLEAMERRVDLLSRSFVRIEQCLRNANEGRRKTLTSKLNDIQSQLRYCLKKVDEIHALVVSPICLGTRTSPQSLSQIKLLQQVFDKP